MVPFILWQSNEPQNWVRSDPECAYRLPRYSRSFGSDFAVGLTFFYLPTFLKIVWVFGVENDNNWCNFSIYKVCKRSFQMSSCFVRVWKSKTNLSYWAFPFRDSLQSFVACKKQHLRSMIKSQVCEIALNYLNRCNSRVYLMFINDLILPTFKEKSSLLREKLSFTIKNQVSLISGHFELSWLFN